MQKANLAAKKALYLAMCNDPEPPCPPSLKEILEKNPIQILPVPAPPVYRLLPFPVGAIP